MSFDGQQPHILVINDAPEILILKREIFEEEGFRVTTLITSKTDLDEIIHTAPDLIILDYSTDAESDLLHQLTSDPRIEHTPLILCTGAVRQTEAIKPELDILGVAVVYKPFDIEHLLEVVRHSLGWGSESTESLQPRSE